MDGPIVAQRNLNVKSRDLYSIPGSPLDAIRSSPYSAVGHEDTIIEHPAGSGPGYTPNVSPRTKGLEGERKILRSYAGGEYFDDDDALQVIGAVNKATQTPVAWQRERRENGHRTGGEMIKGGSGGEQSRDALLAGMLPSMNLMVVPMKSSKGALQTQPQVTIIIVEDVHVVSDNAISSACIHLCTHAHEGMHARGHSERVWVWVWVCVRVCARP